MLTSTTRIRPEPIIKFLNIIPALVLLTGCTQEQPLSRQGVDAITLDALTNHIKELASDAYGGRAPGSPGETLTLAYLEDAFRKAGLEPANGDSYVQAVPLTSVEAINKPDLQFRGGSGEDLTLHYPVDQVIWTRRQITDASVDNSQLVFVGFGINAPERGWNDYATVDVTGKTVVIRGCLVAMP